MSPDVMEQARLYASITDPAFMAWYARKGLTLHLDDQWEAFVRSALAKDYRYADWRSAFQNWLTSEYQQPARRRPQDTHGLTGKEYRTLQNAQELIEEMADADRRRPTTILPGPRGDGAEL
jgi:hypothetical protein